METVSVLDLGVKNLYFYLDPSVKHSRQQPLQLCLYQLATYTRGKFVLSYKRMQVRNVVKVENFSVLNGTPLGD